MSLEGPSPIVLREGLQKELALGQSNPQLSENTHQAAGPLLWTSRDLDGFYQQKMRWAKLQEMSMCPM